MRLKMLNTSARNCRFRCQDGFVGACRDGVCCRGVISQTEKEPGTTCPDCERQNIVKNGRDRRGAQVYYYVPCYRSFTALTGTPFSGHSFPGVVSPNPRNFPGLSNQ